MPRSIFSYRLATLRKMHKMTQRQVAETLGVSRSTYTCYEVGNSMPTAASLCAIGDLFNVSLDYLLGRHEDPELYNLGDPEYAKGVMILAESYRIMGKGMRKNAVQTLSLFARGEQLAEKDGENKE